MQEARQCLWSDGLVVVPVVVVGYGGVDWDGDGSEGSGVSDNNSSSGPRGRGGGLPLQWSKARNQQRDHPCCLHRRLRCARGLIRR